MARERSASQEDLNIFVYEFRRWKRTPVWAIISAILLLAISLIAINILMKHYWGYLFSLGHPFWVMLTLATAGHTFSLASSNLLMYCVYKAKHPFFEQYRSEPDRLFPWEQDLEKWHSLLRRNIGLLMMHVLVISTLIVIFLVPDKNDIKLRIDEVSWPSYWQIVWQTVFFCVCEDFVFYCTHRAFHTRWCYKHIHKQIIFGNFFPVQTGIMILQTRTHLVTTLIYGMYRGFRGTDEHSGYNFPWSPFYLIPFSAPASYHNYHHSHNKGNYSNLFTLWDTIFGTNKSYHKYLEKERQKSMKEE